MKPTASSLVAAVALVLLYPYECVVGCNGTCATTCRSLAGPNVSELHATLLAAIAAALAFASTWV